jgi:Fe-S cluster assembly protein SufB
MVFISNKMMVTLDEADQVEYEVFLKGLSVETIIGISQDLQEPQWMLDFRLQAFKTFQKSENPSYGPDLSSLDLENLVYYAKPKKGFQGSASSREQVPEKIKNVFQRLHIPEAEQQFLAGVGGQYDSTAVYHKLKEKRIKS